MAKTQEGKEWWPPRATGSRTQALSGLAGPFLHFVSPAWLPSKMRMGLQAALSHINTAPPPDRRGVSDSGKLCCRNPRKGGPASRGRHQQGSQASPWEGRPPEPGLTCGGDGGEGLLLLACSEPRHGLTECSVPCKHTACEKQCSPVVKGLDSNSTAHVQCRPRSLPGSVIMGKL